MLQFLNNIDEDISLLRIIPSMPMPVPYEIYKCDVT
jgi:hypothetical protein